jgi:two-component system sensor histidine kinase EvgS
MQSRGKNASRLRKINRRLIWIVTAICIFQIIGFALVTHEMAGNLPQTSLALLLCVTIALNLALLAWLRREVIRQLTLLSTIHDAAREAMLLVDSGGRIVMVNRGAELLFDCSNQQLCTLPLASLFPSCSLESEQLTRLAQEGSEVRTEAHSPSGQCFHASMIASPLDLNQEHPGTLVIVRDESERHRAEDRNRQSLAMLDNITRIQNLLFSQLSRHMVFDEILSALLAETQGQSGCLLEMQQAGQQQTYRHRASQKMEPPLADDSESIATLYQQIGQNPDWAVVTVALQNDLFGLVGIYKPQTDPRRETLEPLLTLYAGVLGFVSEEEWRKQSSIQLQQAQSQLSAAIEAIPEAFAFYDDNDTLVVCNQHYADLFFLNLKSEQIIGKPFDALARFSIENGRETMEPGFDPESWIAERTHRHRQETAPFPLQIGDSWYQVIDHRIPGLGCVCLRANITQLKIQEKELRQATIKADEANQAKSAFLASISHEIRTPLNGILGLLELLGLTALDHSQHETLMAVQDSAQTLLRLIDDILDFSKIEAGRLDLTPEPTAVRTILKKVRSLYQDSATSKGLGFELEIDPRLASCHLVDPLRLRQILQNFVSNAIKFTHQGQILLSVTVDEEQAQQQTLHFSCADSGIGIPAESLSSLFRPFTQAESSTTRRFGGTGLGLAICKRLAEQMSGTVKLESLQGQGTTASFSVTLPVSSDTAHNGSAEEEQRPGHRQPEAEWPASSAGAKILFVEDNPTNRKLTMMQLERIGVACAVAENGQEALDLWLEQPFSLVLTDCHMPVMDGHQLARAIRAEEAKDPQRQPVPIIACTANIGQDEANRALAAGMNQVLTKPIGLDALRNMLDTWLGNKAPAAASPQPETTGSAEMIIDRSTLEIYSQGDLAVELGILEDFLHSEAEDMLALQTAVEAQNCKDARWSTHRIKGAGRMVGATLLAAAAEHLENQAKQEAALTDAFIALQGRFKQVEDWVRTHQPG